MGTGWRKVFCTSVKDTSETEATMSRPQSPRAMYSRLRLFSKSSSSGSTSVSNPTTPRSDQVKTDLVFPTPSLRCRTARSSGEEGNNNICASASPLPSPRTTVQQQMQQQLIQRTSSSNPCSPRSPSRFSLLRNSFRLSKSRCGICLQSVKAVQGTAIFIAECSHSFHFPCIATHVRKHQTLVCPVCSSTWRHVPLLSVDPTEPTIPELQRDYFSGDTASVDSGGSGVFRGLRPAAEVKEERVTASSPKTGSEMPKKGYGDDEPLLSPGGSASLFNTIPEAEEDEGDEDNSGNDNEFQGFFASSNRSPSPPEASTPKSEQHHRKLQEQEQNGSVSRGVEITISTDIALLSTGRNHDKYVVALKVKAPPAIGNCRAPIDLVMVLDVGEEMTSPKLQMLKRSVRQVISSLSSSDRLSIVAFASTTKRLLPLRRMTPQAQRSARKIVDRFVSGRSASGIVGDALRKATRILEDRRERNPVSSIMLLSDGQQQSSGKGNNHSTSSISCRSSSTTSSAGTRFAHIDIPVSSPQDEFTGEPPEEAFARCIGGLLSVVMHEFTLQLRLQSGEITTVYSIGGQPTAASSGIGSLRLGDLYADEERDLLVEIRVPNSLRQFVLIANSSNKDPVSQATVSSDEQCLPPTFPPTSNNQRLPQRKTMSPKAEMIRNLFVTTRAITEARRLTGLNDTETAVHLLSSARALLLRSTVISADENLRAVEAQLVELQRRRQHCSSREGQRDVLAPVEVRGVENGGGEVLTPTSGWRAAERLAKLAVMRKSLNRVSDLHGFEDARF